MELIHTYYRVTDVDRSVAFYGRSGFEERRRTPIREDESRTGPNLALAV